MKTRFVELVLAAAGLALLITATAYGSVQPSYAAPLMALTGTPTEPPTNTPEQVQPTNTTVPPPPTNTPEPPTATTAPGQPTNTPAPGQPTNTPAPTDTLPPRDTPTNTPAPTNPPAPTDQPGRKDTPTASPTLTPTVELTAEPEPPTPEPPTPTVAPATLPNTGEDAGGANGLPLTLALLGLGSIGASALLHLRRRRAL